jgi:tripartite ATP-independent transporter DctP family solute receptor
MKCWRVAVAAGAVAVLGAGSALAATTLKLGHVWPPNEIQAEASQVFANDLDKATGGNTKISVFGGSTLGNDRDLIEGLKIGTVDIWVGGAGVLSAASNTARIFTVPFMFSDIDHFGKVYNGKVGEEITSRIEKESGYRVISYWLRGPRWLTTKTKVEKPDDLKGLKIRVPDSPVFVKSFARLGASPTPMAFGEVFTSLQQGVIDGQENPLSLIYTSKFNEVVKFLGKTEHVLKPIAVVMSAKRLQALGDQAKAVVAAANGAAKKYVTDKVIAGDEDFLKKLQAGGMTLVNVDKAAFQKKLEGFVDQEFPEVKEVHEMILKAR